MAVGNLLVTSGCTWDTDGLNIPANNYAISEGPFIPNTSDGSYTISLAIKYEYFYTNNESIVSQSENTNCSYSGSLFSIFRQNNYLGIGYRYNASSGSYKTLSNFFSSTNGLNYVIDLVYTASHMYVYKNGALFSDWDVSGTLFTPTFKLGLKCFTNANGVYSTYSNIIKYYAINLYDRALSAEEIEENFNTYNTRFNLGL